MRIMALLLIAVLLAGCADGNAVMDRALQIRSRLQNGGCEFFATITADYQEYVYTFQLECKTDADGNLHLTVCKPESIKGVTGHISASGGKLTFDESALLFSLLSEGLPSPISAPWIFLNALKSGYISGMGEYSGGIKIEVDDSYEENALKLIVYTDANDLPRSAEMFWEGRRIIEMKVDSFHYL